MTTQRPSASDRDTVKHRARGCCEYCLSQEDFSPDSFSIEHVTPRKSGGTNDLDNLAFSCQGCNNRKFTATSACDPLTGEGVPLFHPRKDRWLDHFSWDEDFTQIIPLTPTGRATALRLELNRPGVVNLRRALRAIGEHPLNTGDAD